MKIRLFAALMIALLALSLLTGCQAVQAQAETAPVPAQTAPPEAPKADAVPAAAPAVPAEAPVAETAPAAPVITAEEAEAIALEHAGLTADQLLYLHTELDYDHGRQEYDVEFQIDRWEYDYEIHAETGEILSWDKDWDD